MSIVLVNDRAKGANHYEPLETIFYKAQSNQTWIKDLPGGLFARCHFSGNGFSVEPLDGLISGASFIGFVSSYLPSTSIDEIIDIQEKFDDVLYGYTFPKQSTEIKEAEKFLLSKGILGLLELRCPEFAQNNRIFNLILRMNDTIQDLETRFQNRPYSDILKEIQSHLEDENSEDYDLWKYIQLNYEENTTWMGDKQTGKGGNREIFITNLNKVRSSTKNNSGSPSLDDDDGFDR